MTRKTGKTARNYEVRFRVQISDETDLLIRMKSGELFTLDLLREEQAQRILPRFLR